MYFEKKHFGGYCTSVHSMIASHARGHWFKSSTAHHKIRRKKKWHIMVMTGAGYLALAES